MAKTAVMKTNKIGLDLFCPLCCIGFKSTCGAQFDSVLCNLLPVCSNIVVIQHGIVKIKCLHQNDQNLSVNLTWLKIKKQRLNLWTARFSEAFYVTFWNRPQGIRALLKLLTSTLSKIKIMLLDSIFFFLLSDFIAQWSWGSVLIQWLQRNVWVEHIYRHDKLLAYLANFARVSISCSNLCAALKCLSVLGKNEVTDLVKNFVLWIAWSHLVVGWNSLKCWMLYSTISSASLSCHDFVSVSHL